MKLILKDFNYKGKHLEHYECDLPNVMNIDEIPEGKLKEYVEDSLNNLIEGEEDPS